MGMLKVFAGIASLLAIILPSFVVAKSWNYDRRYICLTSQAAGWKNDAKLSYLELTDPETQYIIEPMVMTAKYPRQAKEGYIEIPISHTVKQVGNDGILALCEDNDDSDLDCYLWGSETKPHDIENAIISSHVEFKMHVGGKSDDPIFMTRNNYYAVLLSSEREPVIEFGVCNRF